MRFPFLSHKKHAATRLNADGVVDIVWEIIGIYFEKHTEQIYTLRGQSGALH